MQQVRKWTGKTVLLRIDANVPVHKKQVTDDSRLRAVVPTIEVLMKQKAKVVIVAHLGRPEGKRVASLSLAPVAERLGKILKKKVVFSKSKIGTDELAQEVGKLKSGQVMMLENVRFYAGEKKNDPGFAKQLADLADVYVNDGFAVAHRSSASVVGVAKLLPAYAGLLMQNELAAVQKVRKPKAPAVLLVGGAKIDSKLPVIRALLPYVDAVLVSGGTFNTMLAAKGYELGESVYDLDYAKEAKWLWKQKKVYMPVDVTVGTKNGKRLRHVPVPKKKAVIADDGLQVLDIGPATITLYEEILAGAKTIIWNGPVGYSEFPAYRLGTDAMAQASAQQAQSGGYALVGGGETVEALHRANMVQYITHVSTGGGALLHALSGKTLPGVHALET